MVGTATHIPINHGSSGSSNFADVLSSSYNLNIADYNEPANHSEERRVETLLGQSTLQDGGNETSYTSGHPHGVQQDDGLDRRYPSSSIASESVTHHHRQDSHQEQQQHSILTDIDPFPDTFRAEFITQPLEYPLGGASPPLTVSLLSSATAHLPPGSTETGGPRACHQPSFSIGSGIVGSDCSSLSIGSAIKQVNYEEGSHPSEHHSHSPPSPSSSPCGTVVPSSPHSPSHILPSFIDTYNLPTTHQQNQHGNIPLPSATILAHRNAQYSPLAPSSAPSQNGGNRTIITSIPRQTTLESRFSMFKTEPNTSPSPQPSISVGNITFVQSQHSQPNQMVTTPSTSPSPYGNSTHGTANVLSYHTQHHQQQSGQGNISRGACTTYEPPLHFLKKVKSWIISYYTIFLVIKNILITTCNSFVFLNFRKSHLHLLMGLGATREDMFPSFTNHHHQILL